MRPQVEEKSARWTKCAQGRWRGTGEHYWCALLAVFLGVLLGCGSLPQSAHGCAARYPPKMLRNQRTANVTRHEQSLGLEASKLLECAHSCRCVCGCTHIMYTLSLEAPLQQLSREQRLQRRLREVLRRHQRLPRGARRGARPHWRKACLRGALSKELRPPQMLRQRRQCPAK